MPTLGLSAAFGLLGLRFDPYVASNFYVEFEGLLVGGFSEVSGLQVETVVETYREGGLNEYDTSSPGRPATRPTSSSSTASTSWIPLGGHRDVTRGYVRRKNGSIFLLNRDGWPAMWWDVRGAYPVRWNGPEFRADASSVAIELVELVHRGITKPVLSTLLGGATGLASGSVGVTGGVSL